MYFDTKVESDNWNNFRFVTEFEMVLPEKFTMLDFYFKYKSDFGLIFASDEMLYHKQYGVPPMPSWYKVGEKYNVCLFRYLKRSHPKDWREYAESLGCVCGGDFGLALLWMEGHGKLPRWDFINSPYENEEIERKSCDVHLRYGGPHHHNWRFLYDEEPENPQYASNSDNYFVCFQKIHNGI